MSGLRVLATSRQALGITGEHIYRLPSLSTPAAVELFETRAKAAKDSFVFDDQTALIIADICERLDGIPLAIELAAARVRTITVNTLRDLLRERFRVLVGRKPYCAPTTADARVRLSIGATICSCRRRNAFNRLGVFSGSFTLEGATEVCADETISQLDLLDAVTSLADKSLVYVVSGDDEDRYRLLESVRRYATMRLVERGEEEQISQRLATHVVARSAQAGQIGESDGMTKPAGTFDPAKMAYHRRERGLTQRALAISAGVSQALVAELERGKHRLLRLLS